MKNNPKEELIVICINDKGWPSTIPESHRIKLNQKCKVLRVTTNPHKQTKFILEGFENLDLVTGGRFDGYSKDRFVPEALIEKVWENDLSKETADILNKPYNGTK